MKFLAMFLLVMSVVACNSGGGGGASTDKDLFSKWTNIQDATDQVNLTGKSIGVTSDFNVLIDLTPDENCRCDLTMMGGTGSGTWKLENCTNTTFGGTYNCSNIDSTGTFNKSGKQLQMCTDGGSCDYYH